MSKAVVIYHANCNDGFGAAWAFHRLEEKNYESVDYIPMEYNKIPDWQRLEKADVCFIVDFSFPRELLRHVSFLFERTIVLDHHKTAQEELEDWEDKPENVTIVFDMNRSGAMITWEYFGGDLREAPIIEFIQDRDLWKHQLRGTKEINAALSVCDKTFEQYSAFNDKLFHECDSIYFAGEAILDRNQQLTNSFVALARPCKLTFGEETYEGLVSNCPGEFASDVGNLLAKSSGTFGASYYTDSKGATKWSLRSIGDYDVSSIAKHFGGGGHKNAAGFVIPANAEHGVGVHLWSVKPEN